MSRRRIFGSLCGLVFLVNLARIVFAPLLSVFIAEFSIGEGAAGLLVTLAWVGSAAPRLPAGWLLTKVSRHKVVLGSGATLAVSAALAAAANTFVTLALGAFAMGLASGVYFVSANPFLSELFPERVGRVMGIHGTASQVAAVVAAPFVGLTLLVDWRLSFLAISLAAGAVTLVTWWAARDAELPDAGGEDRDLFGAALAEWRVVLTAVAVMGFAAFAWQGLFNFYELYMRTKGLSDGAARTMLTVVFAAGIPAFWFGGELADRLPHVPYMLGVIGAFAASVLLLVFTEGFLPLLAVTVVVGFIIHALFPAIDTYMLELLPDATRGSAYAVYSAIAMLVQALGSSFVGTLVERGTTYDAVFGGMALALVVVVAALAALERTGRLPS